jgi:hypothetical protein
MMRSAGAAMAVEEARVAMVSAIERNIGKVLG